ncbi:GPI transamidase component [Dispira simplex]|nr:GPI transamidase component [Dispira simplex]
MQLPGYEQHIVYQRRLVLASVCAVIFLGLPLWWKATAVYRADLPLERIENWATEKTTLHYPVDVLLWVSDGTTFEVNNGTDWSQMMTQGLQKRLAAQRPYLVSSRTEQGRPDKATGPTSNGFQAWLEPQVTVVSKHPERIPESSLVVHVTNDPEPTSTPWVRIAADGMVTLGVHESSARSLLHQAETLVGKLLTWQERHLNGLVTANGSDIPEVQNQLRRTVKHASSYQLTFSLLQGDASQGTWDWTIEEALQQLVQPLLRVLSPLFNFTIDSQTQYYAPLQTEPESQIGADGTIYHTIPTQSLPYIVNSQDWNLDSTETSHPLLNFVLYVPSASQAPLQLLTSKGTAAPYNAFLVPRWGGVFIHNTRCDPQGPAQPQRCLLEVDQLRESIVVFITQLRDLLGVPGLHDELARLQPEFHVQEDPTAFQVGISSWELRHLIRQRSAQNIAEGVATLNSLVRLVHSIPNMVIMDTIQHTVEEALDHLHAFEVQLQARNYTGAFYHSSQVLNLAETAFFDPTMLALLYFPNEHKIGVYMPMFVPAFVPIIVALLKELKAWKIRRQNAKKSQKTD